MASETFSNWLEHGWWIVATNAETPMLWITERVLVDGQHWAAFGHERGKVHSVTTSAHDIIFVNVTMEEGKKGKFKLQRQFMMARIPQCCLDVPHPMRVLPKLQENWTSMPELLQNTRSEAVERFQRLSPDNVVRARHLLQELLAYEEMRRTAAPNVQDRTPPRALEETDPIYRVVAAPCNKHWLPVRERGRTRRAEGPAEGGSGSPTSTGQRNVRASRGRGASRPSGAHSSLRSGASEEVVPPNISTGRQDGSPLPGGSSISIPVSATMNVHRGATSTKAESSRAAAERATRVRSVVNVRLTAERGGRSGTVRQERPGRTPMTRSVTVRAVESVEAEDVEHGEGLRTVEETSDEDEHNVVPHTLVASGPLVRFPTNEEYLAGYIWGVDLVFNAKIENIRDVRNVETNHRELTTRRIEGMYNRLCGREELNMSSLTLRPLAYVLEGVDDEGAALRREIPFRTVDPVKHFEEAFLHNARAIQGSSKKARLNWLENNIIWEPVDGQHVVAACKRAELEHREGLMEEEEYRRTFAMRKSRFVVYNDEKVYIEASVRINAKEFERQFYTTMEEDLMKLRAIWEACGRPNPEVRADDGRRARAVTLAASALHWTRSTATSMSLGVMYKRMVEYTRHAWQEDEAAYAAVLRVCRDYENGILWYSKDEERKWQRYASQHSLDPNVDVRERRKRMERLWLRPLVRVPKTMYFRLAKEMAANPVVDGERKQQRFYFNNASTSTPLRGTLSWTTDRIQRREAVRNAIRWLLVDAGVEHPKTLQDFRVINVQRLEGHNRGQLKLLAEVVDKKMRKAWSSPVVKTVEALERFADLIPPMIREHYASIQRGESGYQGLTGDNTNLEAAQWDWQLTVPCSTHADSSASIPIRCRRAFYAEEVVKLGVPCLWIFDCRRCGIKGENEAWTDFEYMTVFEKLQQWMAGTYKWNAIFLFPAGIFFEESMREKMTVPEACTWFPGIWVFQQQTVPTYIHNFQHDGQIERTVQAVGGVGIVMMHPNATRVVENLGSGHEQVPVVFTDVWSEGHMPSDVDRVERTPTELRRLVASYLPKNWGLVVVGITNSLPTVLEVPFEGSQVIVLDGSVDRTRSLYNTLQGMQHSRIQGGEAVVLVPKNVHREASTSNTTPQVAPTSVGDEQRRAEMEEEEIFGNEEEDDEDGEDLGSEDTPVREGLEFQEENTEDDEDYVEGEEEDDEESKTGESDSEDNASDGEDDSSEDEDDSSEEESDVSSEAFQEKERRQRVKKRTTESMAGSDDAGTATANVKSGIHEAQRAGGSSEYEAMEREVVTEKDGTTYTNTDDLLELHPIIENQENKEDDGQMQDVCKQELEVPEVIPDIEETMVEPGGSIAMEDTPVHALETTDIEMHDSTQQPRVESVLAPVLGTDVEDTSFVTLDAAFQITGTFFAWASQDQGMTEGIDGLFHDREGIRYRRIGMEGAYTFEQVTSVLEDMSLMQAIPSPEVEAEGSRDAIDADLVSPPLMSTTLNTELMDSEEREEVGTQSSGIIAETPEAMD